MKPSLSLDIKQQTVSVCYAGPMGCTETSVTKDQSRLCNIPEEQGIFYVAAEVWNHELQVFVMTEGGAKIIEKCS